MPGRAGRFLRHGPRGGCPWLREMVPRVSSPLRGHPKPKRWPSIPSIPTMTAVPFHVPALNRFSAFRPQLVPNTRGERSSRPDLAATGPGTPWRGPRSRSIAYHTVPAGGYRAQERWLRPERSFTRSPTASDVGELRYGGLTYAVPGRLCSSRAPVTGARSAETHRPPQLAAYLAGSATAVWGLDLAESVSKMVGVRTPPRTPAMGEGEPESRLPGRWKDAVCPGAVGCAHGVSRVIQNAVNSGRNQPVGNQPKPRASRPRHIVFFLFFISIFASTIGIEKTAACWNPKAIGSRKVLQGTRRPPRMYPRNTNRSSRQGAVGWILRLCVASHPHEISPGRSSCNRVAGHRGGERPPDPNGPVDPGGPRLQIAHRSQPDETHLLRRARLTCPRKARPVSCPVPSASQKKPCDSS